MSRITSPTVRPYCCTVVSHNLTKLDKKRVVQYCACANNFSNFVCTYSLISSSMVHGKWLEQLVLRSTMTEPDFYSSESGLGETTESLPESVVM